MMIAKNIQPAMSDEIMQAIRNALSDALTCGQGASQSGHSDVLEAFCDGLDARGLAVIKRSDARAMSDALEDVAGWIKDAM